ncbi:MAG: hypothetical protein R3228_09650, partial [Halioglobus sp.]|nr:hypothetical protein [Halioglobus sp.]
MDMAMVVVALALPALMGINLIRLVVPLDIEARGALVTGTGILAGLIAIPLLMRLVNVSGFGLHFGLMVTLTLLITAMLSWSGRRRRCAQPTHPAGRDSESSRSRAQSLFFFALIAMATLHLVLPALELLGRPLFAWDTTMHWATKSRAWYGVGEIVPFVPPHTWLMLGGAGVYTDNNATYPITVPLLQVWMSLAIGRWDESLMNLPWLACLSGMGIAFYGIARAGGVSRLVAAVFTYLLMSLPLLNT